MVRFHWLNEQDIFQIFAQKKKNDDDDEAHNEEGLIYVDVCSMYREDI